MKIAVSGKNATLRQIILRTSFGRVPTTLKKKWGSDNSHDILLKAILGASEQQNARRTRGCYFGGVSGC